MEQINPWHMLGELGTVSVMNATIDHIGWTTKNIEHFEMFWCSVIGFECVKVTEANNEMLLALFGVLGGAKIKRYHHKYIAPDVEIHYFDGGSQPAPTDFHRDGLSHICLMTGGPGSRREFVAGLPPWVEVKIFNNPKGWENIFIRDLEQNWIELREVLA